MGFFDDFRDGFEKETKKSADRRSYNKYRTLRELESQSDSRLLEEVSSIFTPDEEKRVIHDILIHRGYTKVGNRYKRR